MKAWLRRTIHTVVPTALTISIVAPLFASTLGTEIGRQGRKISYLQTWNMYAPDAVRSHAYLSVKAELADGTSVPLEEAVQAETGWGSVWDWQKRRTDMWRYYAVVQPDKQNINRTWYLRGLCVREERARGVAPVRIVAERVKRKFTAPEKVRAGAPGLSEPSRDFVQAIRCSDWPERAMIAADRQRRGLASEPPRPAPQVRASR